MFNFYMSVDSYFEYYLTLLGWVIGNNIWSMFVDTGLFAFPFLVHIFSTFMKVREQGDDEGNKGRLFATWLENKIYVGILIIVMACVPMYNISLNTLQFDAKKQHECGVLTLNPEQTVMGSHIQSEMNGQTASVPLWWGFVMATSKGITHASMTTIPCRPDVRQLRFDVKNTQIADPTLRTEVVNFTHECFIPARQKLQRWAYRNRTLFQSAAANDIQWIGSEILVENPDLYASFQASTPNPHFSRSSPRDDTRPVFGNSGFPNCQEWWLGENDSNGLRTRLMNQIEPTVWQRAAGIFKNQKGYEDDLVRAMLDVQNLQVSSAQGGRVYNGYGSNAAMPDLSNNVLFATRSLTSTAGQLLDAPAFDAIKQALPMLQSFILMALPIVFPIVLVLSSYSIQALMTMSTVYFGVYFLTFWWNLAQMLDQFLLYSLYNSSTHQFNFAGFANDADDAIAKTLLSMMFIILPALWLTVLGWAGFKAGVGVSSFIDKGASSTRAATEKGVNVATKKL